jgi:flagellar hook-associated protein 1 FlgK
MIGGLLEIRHESLPAFMGELDTLAAGVIESVNQLHAAGPSGVEFFAGSAAEDIQVGTAIESDLQKINTSTSGLPGDNDIALAIADLRTAPVLAGGTTSLHEYWDASVGRLGVTSREAQFQEESRTLTTEALRQQRASQSGVSIDEELTKMLVVQQAYQAAVRVFQTAEDMMDVLMNI